MIEQKKKKSRIKPYVGSVREEVYKCIVAYYEEFGFCPTLRDIIEGTSITSTSVVDFNLMRLEYHDKKIVRVKTKKRNQRNIKIVGSLWLSPEEAKIYRTLMKDTVVFEDEAGKPAVLIHA